MAYGKDPSVEVKSLAKRYPKKGIDPTIPEGIREQLIEMEKERERKKMGEAYDRAMPSPEPGESTVRKAKGGSISNREDFEDKALYRNQKPEKLLEERRKEKAPSKYDSVRAKGFESAIEKKKEQALESGKQAAKDALAPALVPVLAPSYAATGRMKDVAEKGRQAYKDYMDAAESEASADRELENQTRRESRGNYARGGSVSSASRRADGIAQRGKTKGRIL